MGRKSWIWALLVTLIFPLSTALAWHLEVGSFETINTYNNPEFTSVDFTSSFPDTVEPLVFVLMTTEGGEPSDLRINNVTRSGFEVSPVEPHKNDGPHVAVLTYYIAVEPGLHWLPGGKPVIAGSVNIDNQQCHFNCDDSWFDLKGHVESTYGVRLQDLYGDNLPVVIVEIQTMINEPRKDDDGCSGDGEPPECSSVPWMTSIVDVVEVDDELKIDLALERSESWYPSESYPFEKEKVAFLILPPGAYGSFFADQDGDGLPDDSIAYEFRRGDGIKGWGTGGTVEFQSGLFEDPPLVVASKNTRRGSDGGWLRRGSLSSDSVYLSVDEDLDSDNERGHVAEAVGLAAFSAPFHANFIEISGKIYEDVAGDGDISGDPAVAGVEVALYLDSNDNGQPDDDDLLIATTTTSEDGTYSFHAAACDSCTYWVAVNSKTVAPDAGLRDGYSQEDVWAEQTYGPAGALCADPDDAYGSTTDNAGTTYDDPYLRTEPGPCYGGKRGAISDNASSFSTAEHVAKVTVTDQDVTDLDFGFSFNVVTNVNDQDDDDAADRTCQGCLRQFIQNANAIAGTNTMRFVPAVLMNADSWWNVTISLQDDAGNYVPLPAITDVATIDGTAYRYDDPGQVRDENTADPSPACSEVGTDGLAFNGIPAPELEVSAEHRVAWVFRVENSQNITSERIVIQNIAVYGSDYECTDCVLRFTGDVLVRQDENHTGPLIRNVYVGLRADGTDPGVDHRTKGYGINFNSGIPGEDEFKPVASGWEVKNNRIGYVGFSGIITQGKGEDDGQIMGTGLIEFNEVFHSAWYGFDDPDGITIEKGTGGNTIRANCVHDNNASGLDSWEASGGNTWENNTVFNNGVNIDDNPHGITETYGARIMGDGNTFTKNVVHDNAGVGVTVTCRTDYADTYGFTTVTSQQNLITQNSFYQNGSIAIDLDQTHGECGDETNPVGDGVTPNDGSLNNGEQNKGMDYPILTSARIEGTTLVLDGYVGTGSSGDYDGKTVDIEVYKADDDDDNNAGEVIEGDEESVPHGEGHWYLGACSGVNLGTGGTFHCEVTIPEDVPLAPGDKVTATATLVEDDNGAALYNTSEFGPNRVVHELSPYAHKIVINEILYNQSAGRSADANDEFVELYNAGSSTINIAGWHISDDDWYADRECLKKTLDPTLYEYMGRWDLRPGDYAVIWLGNSSTEEGFKFAEYAALQVWLGGSVCLNDPGDDVQLYDDAGRIVDYVAYDDGSTDQVDPPPISGIWSGAVRFDVEEGQSISLTPNGQDQDSALCWEETATGTASSRCDSAPPTINSDTYDSRITSMGLNNNGYLIQGSVYEDRSVNGSKDGGEDWSQGETVYIKLIQNGSIQEVYEVVAGTGFYKFAGLIPGDYEVIVDDNASDADSSPTPPVEWIFVRPEDGRRSISLSNQSVGHQDFGLYHGFRITGTVFDDTGYDIDPDAANEGVANDAVQNGDEPGVADVEVSASDGSHTHSTQTDASGRYTLYVPYDWDEVTLFHDRRPASGYNHPTDTETEIVRPEDFDEAAANDSPGANVLLGSADTLAGKTLVYNFGVVYGSEFRPDQTGSATTPGAITYSHTYKPGTQGTVTLSREGGEYTYQVRVDEDCSGDFEDDESWRTVSGSDTASFEVGDDWPRNPDGTFKACAVEVRVLVPDGEPEGAVDIATVKAGLQWANNTNVTDPTQVIDTTTVRILGNLRLEKLGCNVNTSTCEPTGYPSGYAASVSGKPGDVLEYCIRYVNIGVEAVRDVRV
ncbi:MAG: hypothetical protein GXN93_01580, partial [Candidatus Diapherotrites archaeon]|nr:hypothetical protein [Candidatus Diapherotrites archaeon]